MLLTNAAQLKLQKYAWLTFAFFAFVNRTLSSFFRCFLAMGLTWLSRIT